MQYALIATLPLACLMVCVRLNFASSPRTHAALVRQVNIGGLALAHKLKKQLKDSVSLLALHDAQHQGTQAVFAEDFASPISRRRSSDFETPHRTVSIPLSNVITRTTDENKRKLSVGVASSDSGKRKPSLTTNDVKLMARNGNTKGGPAARSQARKVLALQKATRDLIAVRFFPRSAFRLKSAHRFLDRSPCASCSSRSRSSATASGSPGLPGPTGSTKDPGA